VLRWTRRVPKCSSSALTYREIAGCVTPRSSATAENEPTSATRRKVRSAAIKSTAHTQGIKRYKAVTASPLSSRR
jgi:hypothetical protein